MLWSMWLDGTLAGKARAFDATKHPRYKKGTPVSGKVGGGRFMPKARVGAPTQLTAGDALVEPALGAEPLKAELFEKAQTVLVTYRPSDGLILFGSEASLDIPKPFVMHADLLRAWHTRHGRDPERAVDEIDRWVRGEFVRGKEGPWRLYLNLQYAAAMEKERGTGQWELNRDKGMWNVTGLLGRLRELNFPTGLPTTIYRNNRFREQEAVVTTLAEKKLEVFNVGALREIGNNEIVWSIADSMLTYG